MTRAEPVVAHGARDRAPQDCCDAGAGVDAAPRGHRCYVCDFTQSVTNHSHEERANHRDGAAGISSLPNRLRSPSPRPHVGFCVAMTLAVPACGSAACAHRSERSATGAGPARGNAGLGRDASFDRGRSRLPRAPEEGAALRLQSPWIAHSSWYAGRACPSPVSTRSSDTGSAAMRSASEQPHQNPLDSGPSEAQNACLAAAGVKANRDMMEVRAG
jgi:hypothetical protein